MTQKKKGPKTRGKPGIKSAKQKTTEQKDPFQNSYARFYWDHKYIFNQIKIDESNYTQMMAFIDDAIQCHKNSNKGSIVESEINKIYSMCRLDLPKNKTREIKDIEFNNIYHVLDSILYLKFSERGIKLEISKEEEAKTKGKVCNVFREDVIKSPFYKSLCDLIEKHFKGMFIKSIGIEEQSEEFYCTKQLMVWELEKHMYNPNLKNQEIMNIYNHVKENYPEAMYKPNPEEELYEFDFHLLGYEGVAKLNEWLRYGEGSNYSEAQRMKKEKKAQNNQIKKQSKEDCGKVENELNKESNFTEVVNDQSRVNDNKIENELKAPKKSKSNMDTEQSAPFSHQDPIPLEEMLN